MSTSDAIEEGTITELREQIVANAMRSHRDVVETFLDNDGLLTAKPAEIFSIATEMASYFDADGYKVEGFKASLTCGFGRECRLLVVREQEPTRRVALVSLLLETEAWVCNGTGRVPALGMW